MCEDERAAFHAEKRRELGEDDGLAGAGWKTYELTPHARLIATEDRSEALALITAQMVSGGLTCAADGP